jgi:hypothetical protein
MRLSVGVKAANAEYNAKYFGAGRGALHPFYAVAVIVPVFEEKGFTRIICIYLKIGWREETKATIGGSLHERAS